MALEYTLGMVGFTAFISWFILAALFYLSGTFLLKRHTFSSKIDKLPGPPCDFLLGNARAFWVDEKEFFLNLVKVLKPYQRDDIVRFWLVGVPYVVTMTPKSVEALLSSTSLIDKSMEYTEILFRWLGDGLLISSGSKWHTRRKMITPSFHFRILEEFMPVFNEQANILAQKLDKQVGKESFNVFPFITLCALDIICETAMGQNVNAQGIADSEYVNSIYGMGGIFLERTLSPWLHPFLIYRLTSLKRREDRYLKVLHGFTDKVIREKKEQLRKSPNKKDQLNEEDAVLGRKRRLAFLDMLLESSSSNGQQLTDDDIRNEVDTFMFEGHDTTASGINFAVHLLGRHPDVQKKVHDELDTIFGDSDRPVTTEDTKNMKYLECVIKEALRLFPSVPFLARVTKQEQKLGDAVIPAGCTVAVVPYLLHRNPDSFPDPEKFDPNRFLPENTTGRHPYAYIPFSAGLRNCVGQKFALMEEKVVLSTILRKFRFFSLDKTEEIKLLSEPILRPLNGFKTRIERRQK